MNAQVVMITGGSAGVGLALVQAYAARRARIGVLARGRAGLDAACADANALGAEAIALQADVADFDQVESAAETLTRRFGPIDAHGRFNDRARRTSWQMWLNRHRGAVAAAAGIVAAAGVAATRLRRS